MKISADQRFFVQFPQHKAGSRFARNMAGKYSLFRGRAQPHGTKRRHAADKAIHKDRHIFQRTAQKHTAQPGNIKAAQLCQHVQRVIGIGCIAGNARFYRADLALQPCVRKPCPAPGHLRYRAVQQHACHGAGGCRVADAHLPRGDNLHTCALLFAYQPDSRCDALHRLCACHRRPLGKILRAGGNAAVHRARHRHPGNAHIHRHDRTTGSRRHTANACAAGDQIFQHRPRYPGIGLADTLRHHTVVGAKHQHRAAVKMQVGCPGQGCRVLQHCFQSAQPAQGLCQRCPMGVCGCAGGFIGRGNGSPQCVQFRFCHSCFLL